MLWVPLETTTGQEICNGIVAMGEMFFSCYLYGEIIARRHRPAFFVMSANTRCTQGYYKFLKIVTSHTSEKVIWGLMSTRELNWGLDITQLCVLVFSGKILRTIPFKLSSSFVTLNYSNDLSPGQSTGTCLPGPAKLPIGKILGYAQKMGTHTIVMPDIMYHLS